MLLVLTNSADATADYLLSRGTELEVPFVRFDTDSVLTRITLSYERSNPLLQIDGKWHKPSDFSTVWYRRPERLLSNNIPDSPEGKCVFDEWSEAIEGFLAHIPRNKWMNFPAANALASRKVEQLTKAQSLGFMIPDTIVTQEPTVLREFFRKHDGRIIVKPLGRAYVERPEDESDSLIFTNRVQASDLKNLDDLARCPTLFQQAVKKVSDVRITVVDQDIHAVELLANDDGGQQRCDIRRNNMQDVSYRLISLPPQIDTLVREIVSHYDLRFAAIDMAVAEDGQWYFFEVNPNGQWAWLDLFGTASIYKSFLASFSKSDR